MIFFAISDANSGGGGRSSSRCGNCATIIDFTEFVALFSGFVDVDVMVMSCHASCFRRPKQEYLPTCVCPSLSLPLCLLLLFPEREAQEAAKEAQQEAEEARKEAERDTNEAKQEAERDRKQGEIDHEQGERDRIHGEKDRIEGEKDRIKADKFNAEIHDQLIKDGLIQSSGSFSYSIKGDGEFIVNGKKQSVEIFQKYKAIFERAFGNSLKRGYPFLEMNPIEELILVITNV